MSVISSKRVLIDDPYNEPDFGAAMRFRLTYDGLLLSTGNESGTSGKADHKHDIRARFHPQLKRLWDITPFLANGERSGSDALLVEGPDAPSYKRAWLAKKHRHYDRGWVPLVSSELNLMCGVDVLMLRPQRPGGIVSGQGDLDGRLKTIFDALGIPDGNQGYESRDVLSDEDPMYVLLEDDRLITKATVETDQLLEQSNTDPNYVRLFITVSIRPYEMTLDNMQFG